MEKTITEWLNTIPNDTWRAQALANLDFEKRNETSPSLDHALGRAFLWWKTKDKVQGREYWFDISRQLKLWSEKQAAATANGIQTMF